MSPDPIKRLQSVFEHPYQPDVCFVCAEPFADGNSTAEHVFPKWLQQRFNLWNQKLTLLNGSGIPYRQLTIPCCFDCNNKLLSPLESRLQQAFSRGYDAVSALPPFDLFRWLIKIWLGCMCKETSLLMSRSKPSAGPILKTDFVRRFSILHFWLQCASCLNNNAYTPGSLWVCRTQVPEDTESQFDFKDDSVNGVIAMRIGEVGIVADLFENGVHRAASADNFEKIRQIPLHPMQFDEFSAIVIYNASLLGQASEVTFFEADGQTRCQIEWWSTVDGDSPFREGNMEDYARILAHCVQMPFERVYTPPYVSSWLHNPLGEYVFWPIGEPHPFADQKA